METELKTEGKGRKIWIIFCLICFVMLVFMMVKLIIFGAPDKKVFSEAELKNKNFTPAGDLAAANSKTNPAQQQTLNQSPPNHQAAQMQNPDESNLPGSEVESSKTKDTVSPMITDKFITYSPIKISDIKKISKFRSCADKAFGKTSFQDQAEPESSLLHHFKLKSENVPVYAPFDGKIIFKNTDRLVIEVDPFNGWQIDIFGLKLKNGLEVDSEIKAGDEIGKSSTNKIEISVSGFNESQKDKIFSDYSEKNLDSIFSHINESVLNEFSSKGITTNNVIVSKSDRDNKECRFETSNDEDWKKLE